jgi:hypothetical protein
MKPHFYLHSASTNRHTGRTLVQVTSCGIETWPFFRADHLAINRLGSKPVELKLCYPVNSIVQEFGFEDDDLEKARLTEKEKSRIDALVAQCSNTTEMEIREGSLTNQDLPTVAGASSEEINFFQQRVVVRLAVENPCCLPDWEAFLSCEQAIFENSIYRNLLGQPAIMDYQPVLINRGFTKGDILPFNFSKDGREGFLLLHNPIEIPHVFEGTLVLLGENAIVAPGTIFSTRTVWRISGKLHTSNKELFSVI